MVRRGEGCNDDDDRRICGILLAPLGSPQNKLLARRTVKNNFKKDGGEEKMEYPPSNFQIMSNEERQIVDFLARERRDRPGQARKTAGGDSGESHFFLARDAIVTICYGTDTWTAGRQ